MYLTLYALVLSVFLYIVIMHCQCHLSAYGCNMMRPLEGINTLLKNVTLIAFLRSND